MIPKVKFTAVAGLYNELLNQLAEKDIPVFNIKSNNFGHCERKTVIPIGTKARIDTTKDKKIMLLEECVK